MVREMERPNRPLPAPGANQSPADHVQISRRFWEEHLPIEQDKGNRLQTSEKIWGSVAHVIIAIGKQRGWEVGKTHGSLRDAVMQLGAELDAAAGVPADAPNGNKEQFRRFLSVVNGMHENFYQNGEDEDGIAFAERDADALLARLEPLLDTPPQPYTPRPGPDQRRLARLLKMPPPVKRDSREQENRERMAQLNRWFPPGKTDANGFSPNYGYRKPETLDDDDGDAAPVARPPSGSPPSTGGPANITPKTGQGKTPEVNLKLDKPLRPDAAAAMPPPTGRRPRRSQRKDAQSPNVNIRFG